MLSIELKEKSFKSCVCCTVHKSGKAIIALAYSSRGPSYSLLPIAHLAEEVDIVGTVA